ncbi:hypothetical protein FRB99_005752 [Tulasnella sp. 403]|nr:hypothetical protein FRB99_005752 [Tulasnella sp. 403]
MASTSLFKNPAGHACPIYVQEDAPAELVAPFKTLITNYGGAIIGSPQHAIVIVIFDRNTPLALNLISDYSVDETQPMEKGVVEHQWITSCISQGTLLGPRSWGGHYLRPQTISSFFATPAPVTTQGPSQPSAPVTIPSMLQNYLTMMNTPNFVQVMQQLVQGQASLLPTPSSIQQVPSSQAPLALPPPSDPTPQITQPQGVVNGSTAPSQSPVDSVNDASKGKGKAPEPQTSLAGSRTDDADDLPPTPPQLDNAPTLPGQKSRWTSEEDKFLLDYVMWARRHGRTQAETHAAIAKLLPRHPVSGVTARAYTNKIWTKLLQPAPTGAVSRAEPPPKIHIKLPQRPPSQPADVEEAISPSTSTRSSEHSELTPLDAPDVLSSWPESDPPPSAPHQSTFVTGPRGYTYSKHDKRFAIKYMRWCFRRSPTVAWNDILQAITNTATHHSLRSWRTHILKNLDRYTRKVPELLKVTKGSKAAVNAGEESEYEHSDGEADKKQGEGDGAEFRQIVRTTSGGTVLYNRRVSRRLTEEEKEDVIEFLSQNPEIFHSPPPFVVSSGRSKHDIWRDFHEHHSERSVKCWIEIHRRNAADFEEQALIRIAQRQSLKGTVTRSRKNPPPNEPSEHEESPSEPEETPSFGGPYTQGDVDAVVVFLAENPQAFMTPRRAPDEKAIPKNTLWEIFARSHPERSAGAWREFHRRQFALLEEAASKLIQQRQRREALSAATSAADAIEDPRRGTSEEEADINDALQPQSQHAEDEDARNATPRVKLERHSSDMELASDSESEYEEPLSQSPLVKQEVIHVDSPTPPKPAASLKVLNPFKDPAAPAAKAAGAASRHERPPWADLFSRKTSESTSSSATGTANATAMTTPSPGSTVRLKRPIVEGIQREGSSSKRVKE